MRGEVAGAPAATPLARERFAILAVLLTLALAAWALLLRQAAGMDAAMGGPTMGLAAPLFLSIWVAMMVAMMFPAAAPMILMFAAVYRGKRERGQAFVPTWIFVGGYLVVWTLFGVLAYLLALGAEQLAQRSMWLMAHAGQVGGVVLALAGLYQLSPLKRACLARCRSPLAFVVESWRDGYPGALRMGLAHGAYCLGCCWLLFIILFPLGIMNVAAMAVLTLLIFAEKALPWGQRLGQVAAAALLAYGLAVVFMPELLPTMAGM